MPSRRCPVATLRTRESSGTDEVQEISSARCLLKARRASTSAWQSRITRFGALSRILREGNWYRHPNPQQRSATSLSATAATHVCLSVSLCHDLGTRLLYSSRAAPATLSAKEQVDCRPFQRDGIGFFTLPQRGSSTIRQKRPSK